MDPGPTNSENLYEMSEQDLRRNKITFLPTTLREALDCFEEDEVVQQALGKEYRLNATGGTKLSTYASTSTTRALANGSGTSTCIRTELCSAGRVEPVNWWPR